MIRQDCGKKGGFGFHFWRRCQLLSWVVRPSKHSVPMYQAANAMGSDDEDSLNVTLRIKLSMKMKVLALVEEILHLETIEKNSPQLYVHLMRYASSKWIMRYASSKWCKISSINLITNLLNSVDGQVQI